MSRVTKNILIYKDGRVEVLKQALMGKHLVAPQMVDGDWWERVFDIDLVKDPTELDGYIAVGREVSFEMKYDAAELARRDAERRDETMKKVLWGIRNYPGDGTDT